MINQTFWRSCFLAINGIAINLALFYSLLVSNLGNHSVAKFEFPQTLSVDKITIHKSNSNLRQTTEVKDKLQGNQAYQFALDNKQIDLEISYLIGTRGHVETYLNDYTDLTKEVIKTKKIKQQPDIGYHFLLADNQRAYLSSCISPRSLSSVTQKQFSQHRYQNDLNLKVAWNWLQGKASIRDRRCLWVLLSTTIENSNTQAAYQTLEAAWGDLYRWWLPNFPSLTKGSQPNSANT